MYRLCNLYDKNKISSPSLLQLLITKIDPFPKSHIKYIIRPYNKFEAILKIVNDNGSTWHSSKVNEYMLTKCMLDTWPDFWEDIFITNKPEAEFKIYCKQITSKCSKL